MSIHVMKIVWDCRLPKDISKNRRSTVKLVLLKLADNSSDNGKCWPSMARIAHETDMSERSVIRCISELESCNLIKRDTKWVDRKKHNTYFINIPLLNALSEPYQKENNTSENDNPFMTSDSLSDVSDSLSKVNDRLSHKPSINHHNNHQQNTDIFSGKQKETYFIDELKYEDFFQCKRSMNVIKALKRNGYEVYDGSLTIEEWTECEINMRYVDDFDYVGYFDWWINKYGNTFTKKPALTNMVCDMNGIPFDRFYDSTYLQECEE